MFDASKYWRDKEVHQCPYVDDHKCIWGASEKTCTGCMWKAIGEGRNYKLPPEDEERVEPLDPYERYYC